MSEHSELERALWALRAYETAALATSGDDGPQVSGVYFSPVVGDAGLELIIAVLSGMRTLRALRRDPRVAFLCSPGNATRWIQGAGVAAVIDDNTRGIGLLATLVEHAPDARAFVEQSAITPAVIAVRRLTIVESADHPPIHFQAGED